MNNQTELKIVHSDQTSILNSDVLLYYVDDALVLKLPLRIEYESLNSIFSIERH
jgi:hypothetical protein